jgi:signal transduction histidine kinase
VHDELGQALTALKLDLSWVGERLGRDQYVLNVKVRSMLKFIDSTIETVRRISAELRPPILDHFGLTAAIEWELNRFNDRAGIECEFRTLPEEITLDQNRSTTVFRVLQEALTNVSRHANATAVKVDLRRTGDDLILEVKDNGCGITESQTLAPTSLGLIGIRERARMCGGSVNILGSVEQGTTVRVVIPIAPTVEIRSIQ